MFNNRKTKLDPTRINNYNRFLTTLDRNATLLHTDKTLDINNHSSNNDNENEVKKTLDLLIEKIKTNFKLNDYNSSNFTGQTNNDIIMSNIALEDPNYYKYILNKNKLSGYKSDSDIRIKRERKEEPMVEIKETINIDTEINCISDILKLVETYKIHPSVKYNINMKILHDIKEPLEELNNMIGMTTLKSNIVDQILYFVQELHKNHNTNGDFMHTVIYGPPGTGKTEIAKIMGKIYSKIGILKNGTFKKVTRSDLIAGYLGQTALKTRDVIKDALGGVLFIDEAYALGNSEKRDSFSKECIDTLCEALSDNKENLMVIIAGYEKELKECFFDYNQGLDSRFTWRFKTDEYSAEDLYKIFVKKIKDIGWELDENSKITVDWFKKNIEYFKFFGRDIETILAKTKIAHSKRVFCKPENEKKKINIKDLDKGLEIYLKNENIKNRKEEEYLKKQLYNTLYC
jgi:SpoVK/Ycf46/Vps4 family AAA+-type ATPase